MSAEPQTLEAIQATLDDTVAKALRSADAAYVRIEKELMAMPVPAHGTVLSQLQASFNLRQHALNLAIKQQEHAAMMEAQRQKAFQLQAAAKLSDTPKLERPVQ
jgi:hypothetical protein